MTEKSMIVAPTEPPPPAVSLGTLQAASPQALIAGATEMATALASVIRAQKLAVTLQGRQFVKVEGWTTLAVMLGVVAREVETVEKDGVYVSTIELVRMADQKVISRASSECGAPDEKDRQGKPVWANRPAYARRSMAQTRATGKACRLAFSWIMSMAGYEPTPAEEISSEPDYEPAERVDQPRNKKAIGNEQAIGNGAAKRFIDARIRELGLDERRVNAFCSTQFSVDTVSELTPAQADRLVQWLPRMASKAARESLLAVIAGAQNTTALNSILSGRKDYPTISENDWDTFIAPAIDARWVALEDVTKTVDADA